MRWAGDRDIYANTPELVREFMDYLEQQMINRRTNRNQRKKDIEKKEKEIIALEKVLAIQQEKWNLFHEQKYADGITRTLAEIESKKIELDILKNTIV
jgi:hypothetical protein